MFKLIGKNPTTEANVYKHNFLIKQITI